MEPGPLFHLNPLALFPSLDYLQTSQIRPRIFPPASSRSATVRIPAPVPVAPHHLSRLPPASPLPFRSLPTRNELSTAGQAVLSAPASAPFENHLPNPATLSLLVPWIEVAARLRVQPMSRGRQMSSAPLVSPRCWPLHRPPSTISPSAMDRGRGVPPRPTDVERETESLNFGSLVQRN
jgi:hypothetical protein